MAEANWYVVHTYSGYENKVKANIEKTIENRGLQDQILEVSVPLQNVTEIKNGVRKQVQKKLFPGYVLLNMVMNDDTWYVVRNTRGVTGFVGPGSKPVPLTEAEMKAMGVANEEIELDFEVGDTVTVMSGAWENYQGIVKSINESKQTVTISIDVFGRETPVEIGYTDVRSEM
ncbi:MAG: transcription termination/antitermination protein NusG [Lachnospiraceae bacterium]|nr:transcription termination/antitermination protein NusG [Lachnospiraceae bacterium]